MSYGGYEYGANYGVMDPMGGFDMDMGGGFMSETKEKSTDKKPRDRQTIVPYSVRQILGTNKEDDVFKVDGSELHIVKLIGTISQLVENSTNMVFNLNDGTGTIECKRWLEKENGVADGFAAIGIREYSLVQLFGTLREYDNRIHILVYRVFPIQDWNVLTHHLLEVTLTHFVATKGPIPGSQQAQAFNPNSVTPAPGAGYSHANYGMGSQMQGRSLDSAVKGERVGFNDMIYKVFSDLSSNNNDPVGITYTDVLQYLTVKGNRVSLEQLRKAVLELSNDGRIFSTIDDDHYLPTSNDY
eukprot:gene5531-7648_t